MIGVVGAVLCLGQATLPVEPSVPVATFGQNPEDAYLSPGHYTNAYFGLQFDFPEGLGWRPVPMPSALNRRIQLLDLVSSGGKYAAVTLSAYEYKNKNYTDAKSLLRRQLDQELFDGVDQVHGVAKATVGGKLFYSYEARRGTEQHVMFAGELPGYVLTADLRARDLEVLHRLVSAFTSMEFFPAQESLRRAGKEAGVYQGPAISEQHLQQVRESKPAEHLDAGEIEKGVYRNAEIGITYEYPEGWTVEPAGAIEPAVERYREYVSGEPLLGPRERAVVKACRKTLLSVWRTDPRTTGQVTYDDFGEVTLSAMPLACFPNLRFPSDPKDATAVREFVRGMQITQPLQRDMNEASTYEAGGRTFVLTRGTIAYKTQGDALSRRVSVALAMTVQRGYLLIWLFAAPHDAELRELLHAKVDFEPQTAVAKTTSVPVRATATDPVVHDGEGRTGSPTAEPSAAPKQPN